MCPVPDSTSEVNACPSLVLVCVSACRHASTPVGHARRRARMYVPRAGLHIRRARMHMLHAGLDIDVHVCIRYVLACRAMVRNSGLVASNPAFFVKSFCGCRLLFSLGAEGNWSPIKT